MGAWLYDGKSAIRRPVEVETRSAKLEIVQRDTGELFEAELQSLVHVESRSDAEVYGHNEVPGWRLTIGKPIPAELAGLLPRPRIYGRWIDRAGLVPALLVFLAVSASVIAAGQFFPAWIAPLVPRSWERSYGEALVGDFGGKFCTGEGGQQALDTLAAKLSSDAGQLRLRVVDLPIVNAAALPGGNIVIFRELLSKAQSPDEVAGVLAHEIAHVEERHVTQMMIRQLGLSLILTSLGGTTAGNIETLMSARYSRGAETEADDEAIAALRRANISPRPTAEFFARLSVLERRYRRLAESLVYLSSHPLSEQRRKKFERAAANRRSYVPSLASDEWRALQKICGPRSDAPTQVQGVR